MMDILSEVFKKYSDAMYAYGVGLGFPPDKCKDAIQDVFCNIYLNHRRKLEHSGNDNALRFYLLTSMKHRLIDYARKDGRLLTLVENDNSLPLELSPEESLINDESSRRLVSEVEEFLKTLSPKQKEIIFLKYQQGLSYEQISELLDISPDSARTSVYRALKKMRSMTGIVPSWTSVLLFLYFFVNNSL